MESSALVKRLTANTISLTTAQFVRIGMNTVLSLTIAYQLGARGLGQYALLNAYGPVFQVIATLGIPRLLVRELASETDDAQSIFQAAFFCHSVGSLVGALVLILLVNLLHYPSDTTLALYLVALALLPFSLASLGESALQAHEQMTLMAIQQTSGLGAQLMGSLILLYYGYGIIALAAMILVGQCVTAAVSIRLTGALKLWRPLRLEIQTIRHLLRQVMDFFLMASSVVIFAKLDILMLSFLTNEAVVGVYNAAFLVINMINQASVSFSNAVYPILARLFRRNRREFSHFLQNALRITAIVGMFLVIWLISQSAMVIQLVYPKAEYRAATGMLMILAPFVYIFLLNAMMASSLIAANLQRRSVVIAGVKLIAALLLYPPLIWWQNGVGAAIATVLAGLIGTMLNAYFLAAELKLSYLGMFGVKVVVLDLLLMALLWPFHELGLILFSLVLLIGHGGILVAGKIVTFTEISQLWRLLSTAKATPEK
ncbi:MAG: oligosaccharide flippase family protein [Caldilineaceae bacterium]